MLAIPEVVASVSIVTEKLPIYFCEFAVFSVL